MTYYSRDLSSELIKAARQFRILVLTGARQTGKSTLLQKLFKVSHLYVTLDDPANLRLAKQDPKQFFSQYPPPLILDEIQYAPELLSYIKIAVDSHPKEKGQFILTGSQQFTMMKNLQETLAGRAILFQLLPMSLFEGPLKHQNYLFRGIQGSFPEILSHPKYDAQKWYGSYLSTYIEKDVQPHYRLEKISHFRDFIFLLASRTSQILNYHSLSNDLGVSASAIKLWIQILEVSGMIYLLRPYYVNLGSRIVKSPKIYFTDIGLVNFLIRNKDPKILREGPLAGALFENFVIQEVLKHYTNQGQCPPLYFYRNNHGLEVDLVIEKKAGTLKPCEIKLNQTPHLGMAVNLDRLQKLDKENKVTFETGALICLTEKPFILSKNVKAWDLRSFLREAL